MTLAMMHGLLLVLAALSDLWPSAQASVCESRGENFGGDSITILPPPKALVQTSYMEECVENAPGTVYNNEVYSDGNGPRGAHNASECCALCAASDGCSFWSFNIDPSLNKPLGFCRWGDLASCCFLQSASSNLTTLGPTEPSQMFGAKGRWTSGSVAPTLTVPDVQLGARTTVGPVKTELAISATTGAVATDPLLLPLVQLIEEDIFLISGIRINGTGAHVGTPAVGDISFSLLSKPGTEGHPSGVAYTDPDAEKYSITIDGRGAAVSCYAYTGCAWGVTSLLQTLCVSGVPVQTAAFPTYNLTDSPDIPYRGMLVDTARSLVTPHDLMEAAQTARYYKIRYLHLHLTDDHSWTFPSTTFPHLGDKNIGFRGRAPKVYSTQQLQQLVSYADARGVTVIPELEGPGHSSAMRRSDPAFNGEGGETGQGGGVINAANQTVYDGMQTIVQEMADIFSSSPYIHVGCDETSTPPSLPGYKQFATEHNISGGEDLFAYYVKTMVEAVKKTGKKPMIWCVHARARALIRWPSFELHI
jgi:hypothetical protein